MDKRWLFVIFLNLLILNFVFIVSVKAQSNNDFSLVDNRKIFLSDVQNFYNNQDFDDFIHPLAVDAKNLNDFLNNKKIERVRESGYKYIVKKGETLWSISKKFKVSLSDLVYYNNLTEKSIIKEGDKLVIPGVKAEAKIFIANNNYKRSYISKFVSALNPIGEFLVPVSGFNWGIRHGSNATDIAADCGEEVYSSNEGVVIESSDGWNGGYGNFIIIKHPNNVYSLYGHLSLRVIEKGEKVEKGQLIGYVGNTGYTVGNTGCHLHFEIRGAANPLLK